MDTDQNIEDSCVKFYELFSLFFTVRPLYQHIWLHWSFELVINDITEVISSDETNLSMAERDQLSYIKNILYLV